MAAIWGKKQTGPQLHLTCLGEGVTEGLCNPIPTPAPRPFLSLPRQSHPISSPLPLLFLSLPDPYQTSSPSSGGAEMANWPPGCVAR